MAESCVRKPSTDLIPLEALLCKAFKTLFRLSTGCYIHASIILWIFSSGLHAPTTIVICMSRQCAPFCVCNSEKRVRLQGIQGYIKVNHNKSHKSVTTFQPKKWQTVLLHYYSCCNSSLFFFSFCTSVFLDIFLTFEYLSWLFSEDMSLYQMCSFV